MAITSQLKQRSSLLPLLACCGLLFLSGCDGGSDEPAAGQPAASVEVQPVQEALPVLSTPRPSGTYAVGTAAYYWEDKTRLEVFSAKPDDHRRILARAWYPAEPAMPNGGKYAAAPYYLQADQAALVASELQLPDQLVSQLRTHSLVKPAVAGDRLRFPVLLFSPGYGAQMENYAALIEELASHGYIIIGLNHAYSSGSLLFPDGTLAQAIPDLLETAGPKAVHDAWLADAQYVLNQLSALDRFDTQQGVLSGRLDLAHIGMFGHSFGGSVSATLGRIDARITAAANLDGTFIELRFPGVGATATYNLPFLLVDTEDNFTTDDTRSLFVHSNASVTYDLSLPTSGHLSISDLGTLAEQGGLPVDKAEFGSIAPERALALTRQYLLAFFNHHLRQESELLLAAPTETTDARFTIYKARS